MQSIPAATVTTAERHSEGLRAHTKAASVSAADNAAGEVHSNVTVYCYVASSALCMASYSILVFFFPEHHARPPCFLIV